MKARVLLVVLGASLLLPARWASAETAQQNKMKTCNAEASQKGLMGADRKAFMKTCLSAKPAAPMSQQDKMKSCNKAATEKGLKGDARKTFMSSCLSAK